MLGRRGARAERGMPRGWTALCLLSLLPSGFTNTDNSTTVTTESSTTGMSPTVPIDVSSPETITPRTRESTTFSPVSQDSNGTTAAISEPTVNFTSTSGITPVPGTVNSSVETQTSLATIMASTLTNFSTSEMTLKPNMSLGNITEPPYNSTSLVTFSIKPYTSLSPTSSSIKEEIKCSQVKEVNLTQAICLKLSKTYSCEDFKKDNGEDLTRILCTKDQAEAGAGVCSLLLAQSEVEPLCLLLVLANRTDVPSKIQFLKSHQSDLEKLGIQDVFEESVGKHQSYPRKTLIALVTSGILLAVLGTTGYFLMNRRSWSPTGERLELEP
ncbi:hematopoietic progenitor cell antigen CD34 isoform 2-T2 [Molossus nigricans]|uniref:CD34 molecule n=1 Tax=Molossus molossus TaxID=27622 RepID=A0A7J8CQ63_MOLMO|nr:CD34 molecule [Molossus molossus]